MTNTQTNNIYPLMRAMAIDAIRIIQEEAADFSRIAKTGYDGVMEDLVTSADIKAQAMYVEGIRKHFPDEGIIGEEDDLNLKPKTPEHGYFTLDPLDGTKSFGRTQSSGSGTMIAHVDKDGVVDAMCIGDINTGEIFGYGPGHPPTRTRFGVDSLLKTDTTIPLDQKYVFLREHPEEFPGIIQKMVRVIDDGLFKGIEITGGGIGLAMARLWKSEIAVLIMKKGYDTPWDNTPFIGMNKMLGFVHVKMDRNKGFNVIDPLLPLEVQHRPDMEIVLHQNYLPAFMDWIEKNK